MLKMCSLSHRSLKSKMIEETASIQNMKPFEFHILDKLGVSIGHGGSSALVKHYFRCQKGWMLFQSGTCDLRYGKKKMKDKIRNVFVSHHHKDDASVDGLTNMVAGKGYKFRNSSIRVKPENQERLNQKKVSDNTIKRLLRIKMRWASQLLVIIGKDTHSRPWVNWEIEQAHKLGKPIFGVYEQGLKGNVEIPENLMKYGAGTVGWRSGSIIDALNGKLSGDNRFQNPDGTSWPKKYGGNVTC